MPGNPHECRQHARRCAQLAEQAASPEAMQTFLSLRQAWLNLASEIEGVNAPLNVINGIDRLEFDEMNLPEPKSLGQRLATAEGFRDV